MNKLITSILTDAEARDTEAAEKIAFSAAAAAPWMQ